MKTTLRYKLRSAPDLMYEVGPSALSSTSEAEGNILKLYCRSLSMQCIDCSIQSDKQDETNQACRYHQSTLGLLSKLGRPSVICRDCKHQYHAAYQSYGVLVKRR